MTAAKRHRHRAQRTRQVVLTYEHGWQKREDGLGVFVEVAECSCGATRRTERGPWVVRLDDGIRKYPKAEWFGKAEGS